MIREKVNTIHCKLTFAVEHCAFKISLTLQWAVFFSEYFVFYACKHRDVFRLGLDFVSATFIDVSLPRAVDA